MESVEILNLCYVAHHGCCFFLQNSDKCNLLQVIKINVCGNNMDISENNFQIRFTVDFYHYCLSRFADHDT